VNHPGARVWRRAGCGGGSPRSGRSPFVRLFFECVALTGGAGLTDPWLDIAGTVSERLGETHDADRIRLGVAVTRGLLIDVLADGSVQAATRSLEVFVDMWRTTHATGRAHCGHDEYRRPV
jgi:hypothetical protein